MAVQSLGGLLATASALLTRGTRMCPGYLVVGTKRGGSTSLADWIAAHPDVGACRTGKGTHYFDVNHGRGPAWYSAQFPKASAGYRIVGESSPYYMFHPLAPARIHAELPDVKIIMCLRDPVARAWSHHGYEVARGRETLDFETALEREPERLRGEAQRLAADPSYPAEHWRFHAYLRRGHYAEQLEAFLEWVDAGQLLVVQSEALFARPGDEMDRVHEFLGLAPHHTSERRVLNANSPYGDMSPSMVSQLERYFTPLNDQLYALPGVHFTWPRSTA